jgi:hypothetical protein
MGVISMAVLDPHRTDERPRAAPTGQRRRVGTSVVGGLVVTAALACGLTLILESGRSATRRPLSPPSGISVLPFPGTPDASPSSQSGFPALLPWQLTAVTVRGSRTACTMGS